MFGGCGGGEEDYLARFLGMRWEGAECRTPELVAALTRYIEGDYPAYRDDDPHCLALHEFLYRAAPDPEGLLPLLAPHGKAAVDPSVLRRDAIADTVATSFMRRIADRPGDPHAAALWDALAVACATFLFDPAYGDAHTATSMDLGEFFAKARTPVCDESRAALARRLPEILVAWRARVTRKGTSSFFGVVLRHLNADGAEALVLEWEGMDREERKDLVLRLKDEEVLRGGARRRLVDALLDPSQDVREAAAEALRKQGAPVGGLDPSARDEELERASGPLRDWARRS